MKYLKIILIFLIVFSLTFFLMSTPPEGKDSKDKKSNTLKVNCPDFFPGLEALEHIGEILEQSREPS
jgi:hypothetical protein